MSIKEKQETWANFLPPFYSLQICFSWPREQSCVLGIWGNQTRSNFTQFLDYVISYSKTNKAFCETSVPSLWRKSGKAST